jgi:hypothetical protein
LNGGQAPEASGGGCHTPGVPCPCCLGALTQPPAHPGLRDGDRFCPQCEWIFAAEILEWGEPLVDMGDVLKCPTHGAATQWVIRRHSGGTGQVAVGGSS